MRLVERTRSGKLVRLNLGSNSLAENEMGLLVVLTKQKTPFIKHPYRYLPIAKAQLVKAGKRNSLWFLDKRVSADVLKVGASYLLLRKNDLLRGRTGYSTRNLNVVTRGNRTLVDEEVLFSKKVDEAKKLRLHAKSWSKEEQFEVINLSKWAEHRADEPWINPKYSSLISEPLIRHHPEVDVPKRKTLETYEKMLVSYLSKINNPRTSWQELYETERDFGKDRQALKALTPFLNQKIATTREKERVELAKKISGSNWTKSYTEDEMRSWIDKHGAISEEAIREEMDRYSLKGGAHISLGLNLADNELASDFENSRGFKMSFEAAYEWFLFRTTSNYMRNFSLEFSLRYALDGIANGTANALSSEISTSARLFWYPTGPHRMNKNIFFMGAGARLGRATLTVARTQESGTYNLVGLGLTGGYRYNFTSGWGFRALLGLEPMTLQSSARTEPIVHLKDTLSISDFRIQLGLSYVF